TLRAAAKRKAPAYGTSFHRLTEKAPIMGDQARSVAATMAPERGAPNRKRLRDAATMPAASSKDWAAPSSTGDDTRAWLSHIPAVYSGGWASVQVSLRTCLQALSESGDTIPGWNSRSQPSIGVHSTTVA